MAKVTSIVFVVRDLMTQFNLSEEQAYVKLMQTKTFRLLEDDESHLWAESPPYILDMVKREFNNDLDGWLEL